MAHNQPGTTLDTRFSSPDAEATPWATAREKLEQAELFWLSTVRSDGRPHVTPLPAIFLDDVLYFTTGAGEQKAKNLARNPHCVLTTGCNSYKTDGLDLVVEGAAVQVTDEATLHRVAGQYAARLDWHYTVRNGAFHQQLGDHETAIAQLYAVKPTTVFGFGKGSVFSQTRWRFT